METHAADFLVGPPSFVRPPAPAVLIMDEAPDILALLAEGLGDAGYRVATAATLAAAEAQLCAGRFALVVADAGRPIGAGAGSEARWMALDRLRMLAAPTPLLILTTRRPACFAGYTARGFADLLSKPFDLDDLLVAVRGICPCPSAATN